MINKTQNKRLKKVLKGNFMPLITSKLISYAYLDKKAKPFAKPYISNVLNGRESNANIEKVIFEVYSEMKAQQSKMKVLRNEILENKIPEAVTSGT